MKTITTFLFILLTVVAFGQTNFQGKAVYQSKTSFDMSRFNGREMSEERKKQIANRMKGMLEKTYTLRFNKLASTYKEDAKLATPGGSGGGRFSGMMSSFSGGLIYKNTKDKQLLESKEFFGKKFLIKEDLEQPKWELGSETKQIGKYMCFKATMMKKNNNVGFGSFRRRTPAKKGTEKDSAKTKKITKEIEEPKDILITAWYTPQIPVNSGPGEFWGLPGLILEINKGKTTVLCTEIVINPTEREEIQAPKKGKEVGREEYNKIVKKKVTEMREMFRRRRGSSRRGRH